jgi:hypothetical protein
MGPANIVDESRLDDDSRRSLFDRPKDTVKAGVLLHSLYVPAAPQGVVRVANGVDKGPVALRSEVCVSVLVGNRHPVTVLCQAAARNIQNGAST